MQKISVNRPCICCAGNESFVFLCTRFPQYPGHFDYRRCTVCGLVFNSPRIQDMKLLYDKDYFFFQKDRTFMRKHVLRQIQTLVMEAKRFTSGKRLVEIGSARGHLLNALQLLGYDVQGIEISSDAAATSQRIYDVSVFNGTVEQYHAAGQSADFDIALACTVLEHVESPDSFVDACHSLLRAGGILVMDMPNMDALNARASGAAWEMYQKYHIYLFSPSTIASLLQRHHFEVLQTFSYDNSVLTRRQITRLKRTRLLLLFLDSAGLYPLARSWYRKKNNHSPNHDDHSPLLDHRDLETLKPYADTNDAKAQGATGKQGDHLVVVARKI